MWEVGEDIFKAGREVCAILRRFYRQISLYIHDKEDAWSWSWNELLEWPGNPQIVADTFDLLRHLSRHSFTGWIMLYALVYDKFKHNYISRIYQTDKYGRVLLYWMNILPKLWMNCQRVDQRVTDGVTVLFASASHPCESRSVPSASR